MRLGKCNISAWKKPPRQEPKEEKPPSPTLAEFFDKTMGPFWEGSLSAGTYSRYELSFRLHVRPVLGDVPLNELSRDQVKDLVVSLLQKNATKRTETEEDRKLSKDSIRNVVATLRAMLNEAVERKLIQANPATRLGKLYREAGTVREEPDPFTEEEVPILLESTRAHYGFENYVLLLFLFHAGVRASEATGIQWQDLDFRNRSITVRRQYKDGKVSRTKTKKVRLIDMSNALFQELQALKKRRQEEYLKRGTNEIPEWAFLSPCKQPVNMTNFRNRVFWKACDKANIRRRRLHDTRSTFATVLLMQGRSPVYVKTQLGHSSIKMTVDTYSRWIPSSDREAVNGLPSLNQPNALTLASTY